MIVDDSLMRLMHPITLPDEMRTVRCGRVYGVHRVFARTMDACNEAVANAEWWYSVDRRKESAHGAQ